jgi:hypothetical protein
MRHDPQVVQSAGRVVVRPSYVLGLLGALTVLLVTLSFVLQAIKFRMPHLHTAMVTNFLHVDGEHNLPTFYSALLLVIVALLLALIAAIKWQGREAFVAHWGALAIGFLYLAVDDMLALHERVSERLTIALEPDLPAFLYFAWVIPAAVIVLGLAVAYRSFVLALPGRSQGLFVLSGGVYVLGGLGAEMIGSALYVAHGSTDSLLYQAVATVEEGCEMGGAVLFIYALLDYLAARYGGLEVRLH